MKAEQRKELETNTLADKMGVVVRRVKTSPRRTFMIYMVVLAVVAGALFFWWRWSSQNSAARSEQWVLLYDGETEFIRQLAQDKESTAGKAARFQIAWFFYWDDGIKKIAADRMVQEGGGGIGKVKLAGEIYASLLEDCKDDPVFEPQAMLGVAVVAETRAVQDRNYLDKAKDLYSEIVTKHKESAEAKFAQERLDVLNDKTRRAELAATYSDLQKLLDVRAPALPFAPPGPLDLPAVKGKK